MTVLFTQYSHVCSVQAAWQVTQKHISIKINTRGVPSERWEQLSLPALLMGSGSAWTGRGLLQFPSHPPCGTSTPLDRCTFSVCVCVRVCVCDIETVRVTGERCDHVVTEMYGMIAFLKQRGQDFQSHRPQREVVFRVSDFFTRPSQIQMAVFRLENQLKRRPRHHYHTGTSVTLHSPLKLDHCELQWLLPPQLV